MPQRVKDVFESDSFGFFVRMLTPKAAIISGSKASFFIKSCKDRLIENRQYLA